MTVEEFFDKVITVRLKEDKSALDIIDGFRAAQKRKSGKLSRN